uniref:PBPe domain-containing protein n=1 Tax=Macrostomum lignano TaxID=282301 RepID=A0A1I8FQ62_9PLAT
MKKPEQQTDPLQFMLPFSGRVWTCMLLAWLLTSLLMLVCARLSPYEWYSHNDCVPVVENQFGALNSMWFTIGSLMQQAGAQGLLDEDGCDNLVVLHPAAHQLLHGQPGRFSHHQPARHIDSVEALASQSKVKFGCPIGGAMYNFF